LSVAVIINPISGTGGRPDLARARADTATAILQQAGIAGDVFVTERPRHACDLAAAAVQRGVSVVIAWGGDGTINEVASVLAFRDTPLGIIPSGSGNGLARELRIPFHPRRAFEVALAPFERGIDCGELDGRLFFNVAGIGLDARVAHQFAARGLERRGFRRYLAITARELFRTSADEHTVVADNRVLRDRMLLLVIANGRQYGNGASIAPRARLDDGRLDVVIVSHRSPLLALLQAPLVFLGHAAAVPGVTMLSAQRIEITSAQAVLYHVDGEPHTGGASITARVHPGALRVRVNRGS
jgi:YegS/Rv2252/BmrU family lipid kinase